LSVTTGGRFAGAEVVEVDVVVKEGGVGTGGEEVVVALAVVVAGEVGP
jgi:hypothetical protein